MNEPGFASFPGHHLDPDAQAFLPSHSFPPHLYCPFAVYFHPPPAYVSLPPEPALAVSLPPCSGTPSRTLRLSMVAPSVSESTVRRELEVFGDVRSVEMERRREGIVTVHFYDVNDAQAALAAIRDQHMQQQCRLGRHYDAVMRDPMGLMVVPPPRPPPSARGLVSGRVVWAEFCAPVASALPDGNNQGTLVVFNVDPVVSPAFLQQIFEAFGPVRELRETPRKRDQRFVEFYDVRNAARARASLNGTEICGQQVFIEYSRHIKRLTNISSPTERRSSGRFTGHRSYPSKGNASGSKSGRGSSSLHGSMATICIGECDRESSRPIKSDQYKKNMISSCEGLKPGKGGSRPWKGGGGGRYSQGKDFHDPRFLIKEEAIMESNYGDTRTTVMIKNIPNKYSQKLLLNMLDNHCIHCNEQIADGDDQPLSSYDFVYLPIDFINKCNVGYGFVNMTSPQATLRFYKAFHHQSWEVFNSRKICDVTYARLQGLEALREHFKNSKFPGDEAEYMPVVFSPPRDGRRLTEPVPIIARAVETPATVPSTSSSISSSQYNESEVPHMGLNGYSSSEEDGDVDSGNAGGGQ